VAKVATIFDMDGTLISFEFDVSGTRQALISELSTRGFDTADLDLKSPTQHIVDVARAQINEGKVSADFDEVRRKLYSILDDFEIREAASTSLFPQTRQTLEYLRSKGVRTAVFTNSGRRAAKDVLEGCGISGLFEFILTRDDVPTMKPRPEGLKVALDRLRMPPEDVFYVGDSLYDVEASKRAGIRVVAVASGNYNEEKLKEAGADYIVSDISWIPKVLGV
jgi:phosphoglycolate phosphatase